MTRNLNRTIDIGFYPVVETQRSNLRHRPIGIGVQGLADRACGVAGPGGAVAPRAAGFQLRGQHEARRHMKRETHSAPSH